MELNFLEIVHSESFGANFVHCDMYLERYEKKTRKCKKYAVEHEDDVIIKIMSRA